MQTVHAICNVVYTIYTVVISIGVLISERFYYCRNRLEERAEPLLLKIPRQITPDRLSWSRVPLGVLVTFFLFFYPVRVVAILLYTLAWITDILDGALARCWKEFSVWGCRIDPIADKVLNDSIFLGYVYSKDPELSSLNEALWIIIIADVSTAVAAGLMSYFVDMRVEANIFGKWKFGAQCTGGMALILTWINVAEPILEAAAVLGVFSFITYGYSGFKAYRKQKAQKA